MRTFPVPTGNSEHDPFLGMCMALVFFLTVRLLGHHTNSQVWREHGEVKYRRVGPIYSNSFSLLTLPLTLAARKFG